MSHTVAHIKIWFIKYEVILPKQLRGLFSLSSIFWIPGSGIGDFIFAILLIFCLSSHLSFFFIFPFSSKHFCCYLTALHSQCCPFSIAYTFLFVHMFPNLPFATEKGLLSKVCTGQRWKQSRAIKCVAVKYGTSLKWIIQVGLRQNILRQQLHHPHTSSLHQNINVRNLRDKEEMQMEEA